MRDALLRTDKDISPKLSPRTLFNNFLLFSVTFSLVHATVDGVLVYATAELGPLLGGISGGLLYICYAFSSLFFAKNILFKLKARRAVIFGIICLLTYVSTFLMALAFPDVKWFVCIVGSVAGGFGAGIMWTAQGSYYTLNSNLYLFSVFSSPKCSQDDNTKSTVLNKFAAYFAGIYLCSEAACKMLVTGLFLIFGNGNDDDDDSGDSLGRWQVIAFFAFTVVAWIATGFSFGILDLSAINNDLDAEIRMSSIFEEKDISIMSESESETLQSNDVLYIPERGEDNSASSPWLDNYMAVLLFIREHKSFRYLLPYQFSFGVSSTYMGFLIYGIILNDNGKEGYIGLLSALSVLFAGGLTVPVAAFTNLKVSIHSSTNHVHVVMLLGAAIFICCSIFPLALSEHTVSSWPVILPLVCIYGGGRSIWENSNKALIANLFTDVEDLNDVNINSFRLSMSSINECADNEKTLLESCHEKAFAAIYFTSGLGGAAGFFVFRFLPDEMIAASTLGVAIVALLSNHYFFTCSDEISKRCI